MAIRMMYERRMRSGRYVIATTLASILGPDMEISNHCRRIALADAEDLSPRLG
jgi:hypothetical protein